LIFPLFFWCIDKRLGRDLAILLVASSLVNFVIKSLFKEPRPFWLDPALGLTSATSFSFPSGHAQASAVVFGALTYLVLRTGWPSLRRALAAVMLGLLIFLVAFSRVYLGVHFPGDTLIGIAVGLLVLFAFIKLRPILGPRLAQLPARTHVVLSVLTCLMVLGLSHLALLVQVTVREADAQLVIAGRAAAWNEATMLAGLIAGLWLGFVWEQRYVHFAVAGPWWQRGLRYIVGGMIALGLYLGTNALIGPPLAAFDVLLRVLQYALVGFWVVAIWPWLFVRVRLAEQLTLTPVG
jgi:hypothetical protein